MTRDEWKERLPFITAFVEGKDVQLQYKEGAWRSENSLSFSDNIENYRIKPTPREFQVAIKSKGLFRVVDPLDVENAKHEGWEIITVREVL